MREEGKEERKAERMNIINLAIKLEEHTPRKCYPTRLEASVTSASPMVTMGMQSSFSYKCNNKNY